MNKILVIGASGQIGTELTLALRMRYGGEMVIAADLKREADLLKGTGPFLPLDIMDKEILRVQVRRHGVKTIYLLVAMLSAAGEKNPMLALAPQYAKPDAYTGSSPGRRRYQGFLAK